MLKKIVLYTKQSKAIYSVCPIACLSYLKNPKRVNSLPHNPDFLRPPR